MSVDFETLLAECQQHIRKARYAEAVEGLRQLGEMRPDDSAVQWDLAEALRRSGDLDAAKAINKDLLARQPKIARNWKQQASFMLQEGKLPATINEAVRLIETNAPTLRINAYISIIQTMDTTFSDGDKAYKHARIYILAGKFEAARECLSRSQDRRAPFALSLMDYLIDQKPVPPFSHVNELRQSQHMFVIYGNAMEASGKTLDVVSYLNSMAMNLPEKSPDTAPVKPFFFASMHKSGSSFLSNAFRLLTNRKMTEVTQVIGQHEYIIPRWMDELLADDGIPRGQCPPTEHNGAELLRTQLPIYLSIRDPRDATWSWFRHMEERSTIEKVALPYLPRDYCDLSYDDRLRTMFERYLPHVVRWLRYWKLFLETYPAHPVYVARYEDFAKDNVTSIRALLSLCGASISDEAVSKVVAIMRETGKNFGAYKFRQGRSDSWREIVDPQLQASIDAHWDEDVLYYFDYQK